MQGRKKCHQKNYHEKKNENAWIYENTVLKAVSKICSIITLICVFEVFEQIFYISTYAKLAFLILNNLWLKIHRLFVPIIDINPSTCHSPISINSEYLLNVGTYIDILDSKSDSGLSSNYL